MCTLNICIGLCRECTSRHVVVLAIADYNNVKKKNENANENYLKVF